MIALRPMFCFMLFGTLSVTALSCSTVEQAPSNWLGAAAVPADADLGGNL